LKRSPQEEQEQLDKHSDTGSVPDPTSTNVLHIRNCMADAVV